MWKAQIWRLGFEQCSYWIIKLILSTHQKKIKRDDLGKLWEAIQWCVFLKEIARLSLTNPSSLPQTTSHFLPKIQVLPKSESLEHSSLTRNPITSDSYKGCGKWKLTSVFHQEFSSEGKWGNTMSGGVNISLEMKKGSWHLCELWLPKTNGSLCSFNSSA